jgi:cytochrome c oxidase cbb3-type subunit III
MIETPRWTPRPAPPSPLTLSPKGARAMTYPRGVAFKEDTARSKRASGRPRPFWGEGWGEGAKRPFSAVTRAWLLPMLAVISFGCDRSDQPKTSYRPVPGDRVVDFATLYQENCAGCHGADGKLGPAPPLNDSIFLSIVPDAVVLGLITEGRPGTPMPAFARNNGGPITNDQVKALAAGIKRRWGSGRPVRADLPAYSIGESATAGDKARGLRVFARACGPCHGPDGEGKDGKAGAIHDPDFLKLVSDQCLRRYAITGRPDLGMPDFADKNGRGSDFQPLTSAEIADVVALLADWRRAEPAPAAR